MLRNRHERDEQRLRGRWNSTAGQKIKDSLNKYYKVRDQIKNTLSRKQQEIEKYNNERDILPDTKKIIWLGTQAELLALFHLLYSGQDKLIDKKSFNMRKARIRDHFLDDLRSRGKSNGIKPFDNKELGTLEDNMNLKAECKSLLTLLEKAYKNLPD